MALLLWLLYVNLVYKENKLPVPRSASRGLLRLKQNTPVSRIRTAGEASGGFGCLGGGAVLQPLPTAQGQRFLSLLELRFHAPDWAVAVKEVHWFSVAQQRGMRH